MPSKWIGELFLLTAVVILIATLLTLLVRQIDVSLNWCLLVTVKKTTSRHRAIIGNFAMMFIKGDSTSGDPPTASLSK